MLKEQKTKKNHYVPQWYQKGFLSETSHKFYCLDKNTNKNWLASPKDSFAENDLYSTFHSKERNDDIERCLFGEIDAFCPSIQKLIKGEHTKWCNEDFKDLLLYIDAQKIRTPKGLAWIRKHYFDLDQNKLMSEMQEIRTKHCTVWSEAVREIVSAENSKVKFIVSDHPVTLYNFGCPPEHDYCSYSEEPSILFKGTQTIFPLDKDHCLILTNYEYAENHSVSPLEKRINPYFERISVIDACTFIRARFLSEEDVEKINFIIKQNSQRYIAASDEAWLYPESNIKSSWKELGQILLPPKEELWRFGGIISAKLKNDKIYFQDQFGRRRLPNKNLEKNIQEENLKGENPCGCGSGRNYKSCCFQKPEIARSSWKHLSIRERNLLLINYIQDVTGLSKGIPWSDIQKKLNTEHVKKIYEFYAELWPQDTDIISLLPKPDGKLRYR